jgi:2Fe-2S ferredoxin
LWLLSAITISYRDLERRRDPFVYRGSLMSGERDNSEAVIVQSAQSASSNPEAEGKGRVIVTARDGSTAFVPADSGESIMHAIKRAGIDELLALCGGVMACATCHVYVDEQSLALLPPLTEDESDLLDSLSTRRASSRLSCQLPFAPSIDGITIQIAPEE